MGRRARERREDRRRRRQERREYRMQKKMERHRSKEVRALGRQRVRATAYEHGIDPNASMWEGISSITDNVVDGIAAAQGLPIGAGGNDSSSGSSGNGNQNKGCMGVLLLFVSLSSVLTYSLISLL